MYPAVLIVDDEISIIESLEGILSDDGFEVMHAFNGYEALKKIESHSPDIVLLDIWMPGMDGIETLKEIKKTSPHLPVIMITGHGTIESAVDATKSGAYDFLEKPLSIDKVMVAINNALNFRKLEEENLYLRKKSIEKNSITGTSPAVQKLYGEVMNAAPSDASILITGESGTGKEMVARSLHQFSSRPEQPFIVINCAAIPEEFIESELFGHEKGAFTGAHRSRTGRFELADKGTIFLDEIGDMSPDLQVKLLRAIQERQFERVGGSTTIQVNIRVISATNKNLTTAIEEGTFREDLFYRLNVIPIHIQPLRERKEDIFVLTDYFQEILAKRVDGYDKKTFSASTRQAMQGYDWPGNIRELENLIERLSVLVEDETIEISDLPEYIINNSNTRVSCSVAAVFDNELGFNQAVDQYQKSLIRHALDETGWVKARAAERLKMNRTTLVEKIKKLKIEPRNEAPFF